jgi:integrase
MKTLDHLQQREDHWAVPVPDWVRTELDDWLAAAAIDRGRLFRRVNKVGRTWGDGMTVKAVWHIVKESARSIGVAKLAPHDLRRYAESRIMPSSTAVRAWLKEEPVDGSA